MGGAGNEKKTGGNAARSVKRFFYPLTNFRLSTVLSLLVMFRI